jgi:hypothetical protein
METEQIDGQLDVFEVLELIEQEEKDEEDKPMMHVLAFEGPSDRGLCGAKLKGIDGGHTWNGEGVDCVVCFDLAFGDAA